jgi:translation initiation factor 5B
VTGVMGVKIVARGLEKALAGSPIFVPTKKQNLNVLKAMVMEELDVLMKRVTKSNLGVVVHASTIGAAEALLEFLSDGGVPVRKINIGKVTRSTVTEVSFQHGARAYRCILAFDVKVTRDAAQTAEASGVPIFSANIIYHLFDAFTAHSNKSRGSEELICPFMLQVLPDVPMSNCKPCSFGVVVHGELEVGADLGVILRGRPFGYVQIMRRLSDNMPIVRAKHGEEILITVVGRESRDPVPRIFSSFDPYMDLLVPPIFGDRRGDRDNMEENRLLYHPYSVDIPYEWRLRAEDENEVPLIKLIANFHARVREANEEWNQAEDRRRIELRGRGIDAW